MGKLSQTPHFLRRKVETVAGEVQKLQRSHSCNKTKGEEGSMIRFSPRNIIFCCKEADQRKKRGNVRNTLLFLKNTESTEVYLNVSKF